MRVVRYARASFFTQAGAHKRCGQRIQNRSEIAPDSSSVKFEMAVVYLRAGFLQRDRCSKSSQDAASVESAYLMGYALSELGRLDSAESCSQAIEGAKIISTCGYSSAGSTSQSASRRC